MSTSIDQKAYLQKYLGGPSTDKKKKKKKVFKGKGLKIIVDHVDIGKLRPLDRDELDILDEGEDGPQIAGIIDERPEDIKKLEQFKTSTKWRVVTQDDGFNSKLQIEEIKKDIKETQKENEIVFGKMYSDSEDEKNNDSDLSPPRAKSSGKSNKNSKERQNQSDSDVSPPRKGRESSQISKTIKKNYDAGVSPPRRKPNAENSKLDKKRRGNDSDSDISPPRKGRESPAKKHTSRNNDSDLSPPRTKECSKIRERKKPSRWGDRDEVEQKSRERSQSPRRSKKQKVSENDKRKRDSSDSDVSPPRKSRNDGTSAFPQRKRGQSPSKNNHKNKEWDRDRRQERGQPRKERKISSDSDLSPPRKNKKSDSPPRKSKKQSPERNRKREYSSDLSPPRKHKPEKDRYRRNDDSPPPSNKKMERTLDGKQAGLQDARQLREENEAFRKREDDAFNKMTDEVSGRNARVMSRKSKRETSEEKQKQKEKAERQKELDEKYKKWSKGLKQIEAQEARMQDYLHEASKPLARHRGDKDLENSLKDIEREGDPMLQYIRGKKQERGEIGPVKPIYKGQFPPNRLNIRPGYRWDGVDRSNGYEKKYFEQQSKRKAMQEEAYKWSTEDL